MRLQILGNGLLVEGVAGRRKIRGVCIHPMKTYHPNEWAKVRKYIDEYLREAAPTLVGKPLMLDHSGILPQGNRVIEARWNPELSQLEYVAEVTEDVAQKIRSGRICGVSVGVDWQQIGGGIVVTSEGVIPYNFSFDELSLLQNIEAGDPMATVHLWEGLISPNEFTLHVIEPLEHFLPEYMQVNWIDEQNGVQGIFGRVRESPESLHLFALCFLKSAGWNKGKIDTWLHDHPQYTEPSKPTIPTSPHISTEEELQVLVEKRKEWEENRKPVHEEKPLRILSPAERWRRDHGGA